MEKQKIESIKNKIVNGLEFSDSLKYTLLLQAISKEPLHILIVGEPSTGKTEILKSLNNIFQDSLYIQSEMLNGPKELHNLVLQQFMKNGKTLLIDDISNRNIESIPFINELTSSNLNTCITTNPKFSRFDPYYRTFIEQIDLPTYLIDKFDIIFILQDKVDEATDRKKIKSLFNNRDQKFIENKDVLEFVNITRKNNPKLTKDSIKTIENLYIDLRHYKNKIEKKHEEYNIPINLNQAKSIIKFSKAIAMLNNSKEVNLKHIKEAKDLIFSQIQILIQKEEIQEINIDEISGNIDIREAKNLQKTYQILKDLENKLGKIIPKDDIIEQGLTKNISEVDLEMLLDLLKKKGNIYEPKFGFISLI